MPASESPGHTERAPAGSCLRRIVVLALCLAIAGGCASTPRPRAGHLESDSASVRSCADWFRALDGEVDRAGTRDAAAYRIPGFPYLRTDRFLASLRPEAGADDALFRAWAARLRDLDAVARGFETRNLPGTALRALDVTDPDRALSRSAACAGELAARDLADPVARALLTERARVPDDYSDWQRVLGLYGLTRVPFAGGVQRWHEQALEMFRQPRNGPGPGRSIQRFVPHAPPATSEEVADILRRAVPDPLGIPQLAASDAKRLLEAYAPVFEIETTGPSDRFGSLVWRGSVTPEVDATRPTVYRRLAYTRYGRRTLLQLVYTIWFPERPPAHVFDLLSGRLDGVVIRTTIAPDGAPVVYDSIHPCGCYHMFFPTPLARPIAPPDDLEEWAFVPATLPSMAAGERVLVRVASGTHYLLAVAPDEGGDRQGAYALEDEDGLRSLPAGADRRRSVYGPDGLVAGTERAERMLFWPMGIASAGAMRQWGRHATAFLGRRHFDDADLIQRRFSIVPR